KVGEPDVVSDLPSVPPPPAPLSRLTALIGVTLAAVLVAGTLVTGAGPHAGDKSITRVVPRLQVEITTLVHLHGTLLIAYLALLLGLGFGLAAVGVTRHIWVRFTVVLALTLAQALVGVVQFYTGVPAVLVALHVAGAAACTAATAALWAALTTPELAATALPKRAEAQPL
ncbi:heme A synthase, partial [Mycobacteroides abscessus]|nr:heme A synthase [Mycobacteroides abscessus]